MMLNSKEKEKYNRQILLEEIGESGQLKLKKSRVLVVGAGGLGCPALIYLNAAGVGTIGIIDSDIVEESNLHRQVLFTEADIGKSKAIVAAEKLKFQNSFTTINFFSERLTNKNVEFIFRQYDIVIDCTDNFSSRYLINDASALLDIPLIYGSVHRFQGQVCIFNHTIENNKSPTLRCLFPVPPEENQIPNCNDAGVIGILPGLIGTYQAAEAIKLITGLGESLTGKLLCIDVSSQSSMIIEIERNSEIEKLMPAGFEELRETDYSFNCNTNYGVKNISPEELLEMISAETKIQLVDVRETNERQSGETINSLHIPLNEIENRQGEISRDKKVILFCRTGNRSLAAINILSNQFGFTNLYNLDGGIKAWNLLSQKRNVKI
jgi:molybdopterin/thiamine biosynthesis adenylyltransferase/rhodanese-related sulfurtransferase